MFRQPVPSASQRCQCRVNDVVAGDQLPLLTVNCSPTTAVPVTAGLTVLLGPFFESTTALGSDAADALPSALVAVTTTLSVCDTSPEVGVWVLSVAPLT